RDERSCETGSGKESPERKRPCQWKSGLSGHGGFPFYETDVAGGAVLSCQHNNGGKPASAVLSGISAGKCGGCPLFIFLYAHNHLAQEMEQGESCILYQVSFCDGLLCAFLL